MEKLRKNCGKIGKIAKMIFGIKKNRAANGRPKTTAGFGQLQATPADVLMLINYLNARSDSSGLPTAATLPHGCTWRIRPASRLPPTLSMTPP